MKNLCVIGSTGFIGSHVYNELSTLNNYNVYRFSSKKSKFLDRCSISYFDTLVFCAGIHDDTQNLTKIIKSSLTILKNSKDVFLKSKKIIFISSFITSFNKNENQVLSINKSNYYSMTSNYGKSKILIEKLFIKFCKKFNKSFLIISPSHVIGPNDFGPSPNGLFIKKTLKNKIVFCPKCNISIVDVRNISYFVKLSLEKYQKKFNNEKVILNDITMTYENYVKQISFKQEKLIFCINKFIIKIVFYFGCVFFKFNFKKFVIIDNSRLNYIKLNPIVHGFNFKKKYSLEETLSDTTKFFKKIT